MNNKETTVKNILDINEISCLQSDDTLFPALGTGNTFSIECDLKKR